MNGFDRLVSTDQRRLHEALDKTDPDPVKNGVGSFDTGAQIRRFRSVTDYVRSKQVPAALASFNAVAEVFEADVRALSVDQFLERFSQLEEKAFAYDPKKQEARIADPVAFLALKNHIKAVERIVFENPELLPAYDLKEIKRLSILVADDMTLNLRSRIFRLEKEKQSLGDFYETGLAEDLAFLKKYDGKQMITDHRYFKESTLLSAYLDLHFSDAEIAKTAKTYFEKHRASFDKGYKRAVSEKEMDVLSKMSPEAIGPKKCGGDDVPGYFFLSKAKNQGCVDPFRARPRTDFEGDGPPATKY